MECGDNWSEQNDPVALLERWKSAYKPSDVESGEFHPLDYDFVEVLEHGMPPTTGIGPGIERMTMIFTDEENIDNVMFFPMMRPVLSPINAAIYGIDELPNIALQREEMLLTWSEFEELVSDNILKPETDVLTIRPYLRIWDKPTKDEDWKASGYIEADGFLKNKRLRIAGYQVKSEKPLDAKDEARKYREFLERTFKGYFPDHKVRVDEVVLI
jgi:hypothetical protein